MRPGSPAAPAACPCSVRTSGYDHTGAPGPWPGQVGVGQGLFVDSWALSAGPWGSAYLSEDFMLATGLGQPQDPPEPQTQLITIKKLPITPSLQPVLCL